MNMLAKFNHEQQVMSSKELLELINQVRQGMGEPLLRLNSFNSKIEDELEGENYTKNVVQNFNNTESVVFDLTLEQCMLIGMRESKSVRRHVLQKLKEREVQQPRELSRLEILQLAMESEQKAIELEHQVKLLEPKAQALDVIADTTNTYSIRECAKTIGIQETKLINFLLEKHWVYRENSKHRRLCAYAQRVDQKVMINKVSKIVACDDGDKVFTQARITAFGLTRLSAAVEKAGLV